MKQRSPFLPFFLPLALQSASQSLTYPLAAIVASHGDGGTLNLAGLAQSSGILMLLGSLGFGLLTTGMVHSKCKSSYRNFVKINNQFGLIVICLQALFCIPWFSHLLFGTIIGLPPAIEKPASIALLASIPMHFVFFIRTPYYVLLYNEKRSDIASYATFGRIGLTALLSPVFCAFNLTGAAWAVVCLTIPICLEGVVTYHFAKPYSARLPECNGLFAKPLEMALFNLPLSAGGFFLTLSGTIMGAFIARAENPEIMLPVYYLAAGLVGPVSFAVSRVQTLVLAYPPEFRNDQRTFKFTVNVGLVVGFIPLLFILPGLVDLYYVKVQNLSPERITLLRESAFALFLLPFFVGMRAHVEGLAAWFKRPVIILAGQAVYLGSMVTLAFISLSLKVPGNLIGAICLIGANLAAAGTMRMSLKSEQDNRFAVQSGLELPDVH